jgi:hypothetical protein
MTNREWFLATNLLAEKNLTFPNHLFFSHSPPSKEDSALPCQLFRKMVMQNPKRRKNRKTRGKYSVYETRLFVFKELLPAQNIHIKSYLSLLLFCKYLFYPQSKWVKL